MKAAFGGGLFALALVTAACGGGGSSQSRPSLPAQPQPAALSGGMAQLTIPNVASSASAALRTVQFVSPPRHRSASASTVVHRRIRTCLLHRRFAPQRPADAAVRSRLVHKPEAQRLFSRCTMARTAVENAGKRDRHADGGDRYAVYRLGRSERSRGKRRGDRAGDSSRTDERAGDGDRQGCGRKHDHRTQPYPSPISLTNSDTTGTLTLSKARRESPNDAITMAYSGGGFLQLPVYRNGSRCSGYVSNHRRFGTCR